MTRILKPIARAMMMCLTFLPGTLFSQSSWDKDFTFQELQKRPELEVSYKDTYRDHFVIDAEMYHLTGDLLKPNLLYDTNNKEPWLWFEMTDNQGKKYSTRNTGMKSRINLYRRGAYFCEIHWFDIKFATENGVDLPIRTEVILYCFPDKIKGSVKLYPSENVEITSFSSKGRNPQSFAIQLIQKDNHQYFNFDLLDNEKPLDSQAITTKKGKTPLRYDPRKGIYIIGSETVEGFQRQYFNSPNGYEEVAFKIKNDATPRKIYICQETLTGEGIVEGGAVLDATGHPLPILVQVCKNFAGEKEEKFYNPRDTAFSETYFPLYLESYEEVDIRSLHLYQNWGRHMTKHWSSLGFFMDYFHTSTGVTETTCYIPFKFGHKTGIMVGDFRAMSQETFWSGQPQHDNVAGHNFLTYYDGKQWNYSEYQGTTYKSTGNNWCNVEMKYLSSDSCIRFSLDIWEVPQDDELRSYFTAKYTVLKPLKIENARENFRFLDISTTQQKLRYKRYAFTDASGKVVIRPIDFGTDSFCARGIEIPAENSFAAVIDEPKGSNGIMVQRFDSNSGVKPAFSIQHKIKIPEPKDTTVNEHKVYTPPMKPGDILFSLVPATDLLVLNPGDEITLTGYWLPYGEVNGAETPAREIKNFGSNRPAIVSISKGSVLNHFPATIQVENNQAEFSLEGGFNIVPVIARGLTDFRNPLIYRKINGEWKPEYHHQNTPFDGNQVFCDSDGKFGAVFLVRTNGTKQEFMIRSGNESVPLTKLQTKPVEGKTAVVSLGGSSSLNGFRLGLNPAMEYNSPLEWNTSEGNSVWFSGSSKKMKSGARVTGFEDYATIQCWWQKDVSKDSLFSPVIELQPGPDFINGDYQLLAYSGGSLKPFATNKNFNLRLKGGDYGILMLYNKKENVSYCLAFRDAAKVSLKKKSILSITLSEQICPSGRRKVFQGYFYQVNGTPEELLEQVRQEIPIRIEV